MTDTIAPAKTTTPDPVIEAAQSTNRSADNDGPATGKAVASLVLGIVGIALALTFILGQFGAVLAMVGLPLGFFAARKNKRNGHNRGMAKAGMILCAIAIPLGFATAAAAMAALDDLGNEIDTSFTVLEAEWHLEGEYGWAADAISTDVVDGRTTITVYETGTTNVLGTHLVEITDDGRFIVLD